VILRRKRLPAELQEAYGAFRDAVAALDRGKAALAESVPTTRLPGRPLAETLLEFEEALREADLAMPGWRVPALEREWRAADAAISACREMSERLRLEGTMPEGFEALIGTIADLMAPLDAFEAAEERFRSLRV
jgi:hypothetical protein